MSKSTGFFVEAGEKAAKEHQRRGTWPVYETFEVRGEGRDLHVYAPFDPPPPPETGTGYVQIGQADRNRKGMYAPLRDEPDLFLRFAELGRKGRVSTAEMLDLMIDWVKKYGTLGVEDAEGRKQSLHGFITAAVEAARCLALYIAYTTPGEQREATIRKAQDDYGPVGAGRQRQYDEIKTIFEVMHTATSVLEEQCYPTIYRYPSEHGGTLSGFSQGWGFRSLLGAMYLQMMWLMADDAPRCKGPGCNNPIRIGEREGPHVDPATKTDAPRNYKTRVDKQFCSRSCKENYRYHNRIKPKREAERRQ